MWEVARRANSLLFLSTMIYTYIASDVVKRCAGVVGVTPEFGSGFVGVRPEFGSGCGCKT